MADFQNEKATEKESVDPKQLERIDQEIKDMSDVERKKLVDSFPEDQRKTIESLLQAESAKSRYELFAKISDDLPGDTILSLIPGLGDYGSSLLAGLYFMKEARNADLGFLSYGKNVGLQVVDATIGSIPILGDITDYFFKANKWSANSFDKRIEEMVKEAEAKGVSPEDIQKLRGVAKKTTDAVESKLSLKTESPKAEMESKVVEPSQKGSDQQLAA